MTCDCRFPIADCHADWLAAGGRQYPLEAFEEMTRRLFTAESYFFQGWHMAAHKYGEWQLDSQAERPIPHL